MSNSSQPTWKRATFPDIASASLQFPDENLTVLITQHAAVVGEKIQVETKRVYL